MPDYQAPLRDLRFVMDEMLDYPTHYAGLPGGEEATPDVVGAILEEGARFAREELLPLNQSGDLEGCLLEGGEVKTPKGFKEAYSRYVEGGWPGLAADPEQGGQGLPPSLAMVLSEMICATNLAWGMYPGLSHGAADALRHHGTEAQQATYLSKLVEGVWTGTMCLTEPHCGTDLGLIKTRAVPNDDDSYTLSGTKIFISAGDHDLAENIVHLVLAKLPDAPAGSKGISLFVVPKFLPDADGNPGERNGVSCGSLEHKMGIHGNATCVMNFDGARGFLVGKPHKGLACMFTMMNAARIGVGIQGLGLTEASFQNALAYARDRLQMRALSGAKAEDKPADPIIVHPDVRRMLLTQKAFAEGGRMLVLYAAQMVDVVERSDDTEQTERAETLLGLLTPIVKAFLTEVGFEATNEGVQVFGGHGFIQEWGMEQLVRDARITRLYEGTTGIQALDLLGRKVLMSQGETLKIFTKEIHKFCQAEEGNPDMAEFVRPLAKLNAEWGELTMGVGMKAMNDREEVGAASVDYLMYSGYVTLAYLFARAVKQAKSALAAGTDDAAFYRAKVNTARFYYERLLPRTRAHVQMIQAGGESLMALSPDDFGRGFEI
ncbi:acyl-CoA dehydrogenase C-terminal domain-containing protein [Halomonas elongata]|uniref:3-methylmercaptopropionyl-CoA dehydrogenase n=1 Tax=Halomonas elongata (strain ATCC 33173 / DSM 2581 / NBRC 15536 / NCIMB 2198 / 1H9) TaxID=768066 RepID=E1VAI2_HALED|nr:acyl-CoA dehydrogenase C-terminal domain-containing protein [Halomonas elongata]RAW06966.1 acyl-CoA dehydrogenase [Halomonas elongata]WBF19292.1 acyl-CoA dehydrogenase C-terminal domain-containing protein [Halomonas elongata]WPU48152.1 acyl-CoA dehydrogenase C-terminal domain-containing protein [Halomonas elongata DSM 2581]CBV42028.1 acyl-CoA dehydrogenase family protein [Halomonas elongata DSM 2581]